MAAFRILAGGVAAGLAMWIDAAAAQTVVRLSDNVPLEPTMAGPALAGGPVALTLPAGGAATLLGAAVSSRSGGLAYVAASADDVTFADVGGDLHVGRVSLRPGQAAVVSLRTGRIERFEFDAARFIASAPPTLASDVQARLQPVAAQQRRRLFWGLLSPTGVNARAPGSAAMEAARESYLMYPALLDIRARAGADAGAARRLTAGRFVQALADRDFETVASLMDPEPFLAAGPQWAGARRDFARGLTSGALPGRLAGAEVAPGADGFTVAGAGQTYSLAFVERDGVVFVSRLEPR